MKSTFLTAGFAIHDFASDFLAKNFLLIKRLILIVAYISLIFVFFPDVRRGFGNLAEGTLLFILFLSPLSKIFRMRLLLQLMGLRREMGILMGCFALVHGVSYFMDPVLLSITIVPYLNANFFSMQPLFSFGILSLVLTLPLFFTSNNVSMRLLGAKKWKMLHRIVYVLLLTVLLHVLFLRSASRGYSPVELIQPTSILLGYVFLKALAWKNFITPLRDMIVFVSDEYARYALAKKAMNVSGVV